MSWDILPKAKLQYLLTRLKEVFDKKVDKEQGKGLFSGSYNDLTDQPTIPSVSANPSTTTETLTGIEIDGTGYAVTANTAAKLSTARAINLGRDLTGTANFDGSSDITINANFYSCNANGGNKANYPWHRIAKIENVTGTYNDRDAIFLIRRACTGGGFGILKVSLRTNERGAACGIVAYWMVRYEFAASAIKVAIWGTTGQSVYADVFLQCSTYPRTVVSQIVGSRQFTLIDSNEVNDTTSSDKKGSVECYASVEVAATEIHNQAYTGIGDAVDYGSVKYAYTAGTATDSTKVAKAGDTMTGVLTNSYQSSTWVNSLTNSALTLNDTTSGFGGWVCGPTKDGRIVISSFPGTNNTLYFGYGERGRTTNSYAKQMTWNGPTNDLGVEKINGMDFSSRLNALKSLTNENVSTSAQYFLTITNSYGKGGYCSVADAKTVLGLGSAAYINADTAASANTVVRRQGNGYIYAVYYNASNGAENINSYSGAMPVFSDTSGWLRKTSIANMKTALSVPTNTNQLTNGAGFITSSGNCNYAKGLWTGSAAWCYLDNLSQPTIWGNGKGIVLQSTSAWWVTMQGDGNLVIYQNGAPKWSTGTSSQRFKHNIKDMTEERARQILKIRAVTFDWNYDQPSTTRMTDNAGVIAEEVSKVTPDLVVFEDGEDGGQIERRVEYERFTPYLIKMVQMQQKEIDLLKEEIRLLKERI